MWVCRRFAGFAAALWLPALASPSQLAEAGQASAPPLQPVLEACGAPAPRDAEVRSDGTGATHVLCPIPERVANHPIRLHSECRRRDTRWRCEPLGKEFVLDVNGRQASVLYPAGLDSWAAYQMAQAITPLAVAVARDARTRRMEHCRISGDYSDLKVARMVLRCQDWTVDFVRLCDANGCRHEPAGRISNATPKHRTRR
jgi:hypothetical protein